MIPRIEVLSAFPFKAMEEAFHEAALLTIRFFVCLFLFPRKLYAALKE